MNYDPNNRITLLKVGEGSTAAFSTQYKYIKSRLDKVQTDGQSAVNDTDGANVKYTYYPNGQIHFITYPPLADRSVLQTEYSYDNLKRLSNVTNSKGSVILSTSAYSYDDNGNIKTLIQMASNQPTQNNTYTYDKLNRLVSIVRSDGSSVNYTYDLKGNRLTLSDTVNGSFAMDELGYQYDLFNNLIAATKGNTTTTFSYSAEGMRYKKTTGPSVKQYRYNEKKEVVSELIGSNTVTADYVRGDRLLVKKDRVTNKDYYYLYNGRGDVIQIVDTSGNIVNSYAYDAWGNITSQTEGISNSFKYAGEIYDEETGLYYLSARYYDPSVGRFLNEETYEGQIDNLLSLNLYTYVENNPLTHADPTGHFCTSTVNGKTYSHAGGCNAGGGFTVSHDVGNSHYTPDPAITNYSYESKKGAVSGTVDIIVAKSILDKLPISSTQYTKLNLPTGDGGYLTLNKYPTTAKPVNITIKGAAAVFGGTVAAGFTAKYVIDDFKTYNDNDRYYAAALDIGNTILSGLAGTYLGNLAAGTILTATAPEWGTAVIIIGTGAVVGTIGTATVNYIKTYFFK